jgi:hypothetical protein
MMLEVEVEVEVEAVAVGRKIIYIALQFPCG